MESLTGRADRELVSAHLCAISWPSDIRKHHGPNKALNPDAPNFGAPVSFVVEPVGKVKEVAAGRGMCVNIRAHNR